MPLPISLVVSTCIYDSKKYYFVCASFDDQLPPIDYLCKSGKIINIEDVNPFAYDARTDCVSKREAIQNIKKFFKVKKNGRDRYKVCYFHMKT